VCYTESSVADLGQSDDDNCDYECNAGNAQNQQITAVQQEVSTTAAYDAPSKHPGTRTSASGQWTSTDVAFRLH